MRILTGSYHTHRVVLSKWWQVVGIARCIVTRQFLWNKVQGMHLNPEATSFPGDFLMQSPNHDEPVFLFRGFSSPPLFKRRIGSGRFSSNSPQNSFYGAFTLPRSSVVLAFYGSINSCACEHISRLRVFAVRGISVALPLILRIALTPFPSAARSLVRKDGEYRHGRRGCFGRFARPVCHRECPFPAVGFHRQEV